MRAFLIPATLTCIFFFETPCPAQTAKPESNATNAQSAATHAATTASGCWFSGSGLSPNCVLRDGQGNLFIAQDYLKELDFDSHGLAQVCVDGDSRHGWMYVNRKGRVIISGVPSFDNWADSFSGGLVRTVVNEKYGFANRKGKIVIAPKYDWASPFERGYAEVCMGCREICANPGGMGANSDVGCDHHVMTGGEWFRINKTGRVVATVRR